MSPSSLFLCLVVVVSLFWDFGSLFRTVRCHSGLLLRQQQCDSYLTLRRPSGQLLRQQQCGLEFDVAASLWPAVAAAAISTKDDAGSLLPTVAAAAHSE